MKIYHNSYTGDIKCDSSFKSEAIILSFLNDINDESLSELYSSLLNINCT